MTGPSRWSLADVVCALLVIPVTVSVQHDEDGCSAPGKDWPLFGGDWANSRHSTLAKINTQNVNTLGAAWNVKFDASASTRAGAVVKDGLLFISAGTRLRALNAKTGAEVWTWRPAEQAPALLEAGNIGDLLNSGVGIPAPQGVSLGEGLVFVGLMDGHVAALRQKTGEVVWKQQIGYTPAKTGPTVTFTNNGQLVHTVQAADGSWTTGPLVTAESGYVKFDKPGTYRYICKDHPWAIAEITVQ